jgi:hypothetical protein
LKHVGEIKIDVIGELSMKYKPEDYVSCDFYGGDDTEIENHNAKVVKCRKPHKCMGGCDGKIKPGEYALCETGFIDKQPMSSYTCLPCIDKWLDEIHWNGQ